MSDAPHREFAMTAHARKALSSVMHYLSWARGTTGASVKEDVEHRVGEYHADYSEPTFEQINKPQPELEELLKNSKVISVKREL
jgi:hypothetical protein